MTLNPLAEKAIGYANLKRIALTAKSEPDRFAEPETESDWTETLGHGCATRIPRRLALRRDRAA